MSEWISVETEKPKDGEYVQVYLGYGRQAVCRYSSVGDLFYCSVRLGRSNGGVTHWMPLPEPPKE